MSALPPVDAGRFRQAMARMPGAVSVVTVQAPEARYGRTVSAVMSLSAEPPSLLISLLASAPIAEAVARVGVFSLAVVSEANLATAMAFAGQPPMAMEERFGVGTWTRADGGFRLDRASVNLDCRVAQVMDIATHRVIVAEVVAIDHTDQPPLTYLSQTFGLHAPLGR